MSTFFHRFTCPTCGHTCVIEDDGRVAYAYLTLGKQILADLWLYNQAPTPATPEWKDRSKAPFLNPAPYVAAGAMSRPVTSASEIEVVCQCEGQPIATFEVRVRGVKYGLLRPGEKPGSTVAAAKDGPLAKVLET
jgi:hypothetical protein